MPEQLEPIYRGSVKDVLGPTTLGVKRERGYVFEFSDCYSVFDWGRMPDKIAKKGETLCFLAAWFFEWLENPLRWQAFSKSELCHRIRKSMSTVAPGYPLGAVFNECGERLKNQGLQTHYLGLLTDIHSRNPLKLVTNQPPTRWLCCRALQVKRPEQKIVLGKMLSDYKKHLESAYPKLIPLEVVFRFEVIENSSLLKAFRTQPSILHDVVMSRDDRNLEAGKKLTLPSIEFFSKLEPTDRRLSIQEAFVISSLNHEQFEDLIFKSIWVSGMLHWVFGEAGFQLQDGKLEWGVQESGQLLLADAIGPDELRLIKNEKIYSKEMMREHYRSTSWYKDIELSKAKAADQGKEDWKSLVKAPLDAAPQELLAELSGRYLDLKASLLKRWGGEAGITE